MRRRSTCRRRIRNVVVTVTVAVAAVYTSICLCPYASVYYTGRRVFLPKCFESSPIETAARIKRGDGRTSPGRRQASSGPAAADEQTERPRGNALFTQRHGRCARREQFADCASPPTSSGRQHVRRRRRRHISFLDTICHRFRRRHNHNTHNPPYFHSPD